VETALKCLALNVRSTPLGDVVVLTVLTCKPRCLPTGKCRTKFHLLLRE